MHQQDQPANPERDITQPGAHFWTEITEETGTGEERRYVISDSILKNGDAGSVRSLLLSLISNLKDAMQEYNFQNMPSDPVESYQVDAFRLKGKFSLIENDTGFQVVATLPKEAFAAINDIDLREIALEVVKKSPIVSR